MIIRNNNGKSSRSEILETMKKSELHKLNVLGSFIQITNYSILEE